VALVAQQRLRLMSERSGHTALASHWLQGNGRAALEQALGLKHRRAGLWQPAPGFSRTAAYLGALLLVAWLFCRPEIPTLQRDVAVELVTTKQLVGGVFLVGAGAGSAHAWQQALGDARRIGVGV
jgi:hypothetical protein